jgi:small conductance mechanosensitive channel
MDNQQVPCDKPVNRVVVVPLWLMLSIVLSNTAMAGDTQATAPVAITASNPDIALDELELLVKPLTVAELIAEGDAWLNLLQIKTSEVSQAEIAVKQKNKTLEKAEDVQEAIDETQELLDDVRELSSESTVEATEQASELAEEARAAATETAEVIEDTIDTARQVADNEHVQQALDASAETQSADLTDKANKAQEATEAVSRSADKAVTAAQSGRLVDAARLADATVDAVEAAQDALVDTSDAVTEAVDDAETIDAVQSAQLDETAEAVEALAESEMEDKIEILDAVTVLQAQRTGLIDRLTIVLDDLASKLPPGTEGAENETIVPYRLYAASVGGIQVDVSDSQAAWTTLVGWARSEVGGKRLARNIGIFFATVIGFWMLGLILGKLLDKAMLMSRNTAMLMRDFIVRSVSRGFVVLGIIIGLTVLDVNIGPVLAVIGAAGFVVAFALQNTLSNFASGMMIMLYRPFDVGDQIKVADVTGVAQSMNLVNTTIATLDNQVLIVPNNSIWGNTIINITGSETRRVDLIVGISYNDDIAVAERLMHEILQQHPLVLNEPEAVIAVDELAEYSVNFVCRPWTKTPNYLRVYWDLTRSIKERFEQAGLETPYPHHNIHQRNNQDSLA